MQVNQAGFENSFKQHLDAEQRRAVLEAIGARINPDSTIGEVLDAAEALGWSEQMGGFSLADLAEALLAPESNEEPELTVAEDEEFDEDEDEEFDEDEDEEFDEDEDEEFDEDEDEDEFELVVQESPPRRKKSASKKTSSKKKTKKAASKKTSSKKAASKKTSSKKKTKKAASKKTSSKKSAKKTSSKKSAKKKASRYKLSEDDVDTADRMSLDQAAEFFLPHVEALGEATMQALEEETGVSRRKLRFHVGQLVKNGYLERHGMGRGTYYTLA